MRRSVGSALCAILAGTAAFGVPVMGQNVDSPARDSWAFPLALMRVQSGDARCGNYWGVSGGAEVRTQDPSFVALRAEILGGLGSVCTTQGIAAQYEGQQVEVRTTTDLPLVPRLTARLGHVVMIGRTALEIGAGVGVIHLRSNAGDGGGGWTTWYGGSVGVHSPGAPVGVEFRYGERQVPVRYVRDGSVVHNFSRREGLWRVALVF